MVLEDNRESAQSGETKNLCFTVGGRWSYPTYLLLAAILLLILFTFTDYGVTYDEEWRATYGEYIVRWYTSLFRDTSALEFWHLGNYGGFFDSLAQLAVQISPIGLFETRHLVNAFFGFLGFIAVYKIANRLAGPAAGFLALIFLILTPRYYGQIFNNPKDVPFAALFMCSLYFIIRAIDRFPRLSPREILPLGLLIGFTAGIRIGGIVLLGFLLVGFILWLVAKRFTTQTRTPGETFSGSAAVKTFASRYLAVCVLAYVSMLVAWPAAQARPFVQPLEALLFPFRFEYPFEVYFEGRTFLNSNLPWYYLLKWFVITLPEFYFLGLAAGSVLAVIGLGKQYLKKANQFPEKWIAWVILFLVVTLPVFYVILTQPVIYDGVRQYLFVAPPLAALSASVLVLFMERIRGLQVLVLVLIVLAFSVAWTARDMILLHPHQYVYFNRVFGGGLKNASKDYETDYWGNSFKEGVDWLQENYRPATTGGKIKVGSCLHSASTAYYLKKDRFKYVGSIHDGKGISETPDIFLAVTRWNCDQAYQGEIIHTVRRMGAPLLFVIRVTDSGSG